MIKVTVGNSVKRDTVIVSANTTLRSILEDADIDYARGSVTLDGATLKAGDFDKTLEEFGITERCYLLSVVKTDNAR